MTVGSGELTTARSSSARSLRALCLCGALLLVGGRLAGQEEAVVEQLAPLIAAEDARDFHPELFSRALVAPDSVVRRIAALGAGRIGDLRATPLLRAAPRRSRLDGPRGRGLRPRACCATPPPFGR